MVTLLFGIGAFFVGGIPFGYMVGRLILKDDIRNHGSGNIGATNVGRVIGWKWGCIVLLLDAIKGLVPTFAAKLYGTSAQFSTEQIINLTLATGVCAILGHMYPIYLRLRGGKGVATALGVVLIIAPWSSLFALGAFLAMMAAFRVVALASISAAVTFCLAQLIMLGDDAANLQWLPLTLFSIAIPALIIWRHRSNILRIFSGQEKTFSASVGKKDFSVDAKSNPHANDSSQP